MATTTSTSDMNTSSPRASIAERGITGTITALITPRYTIELEPNFDFYQVLVRRQLDNMIDGLVLFGTTGEADFVSDRDKNRIMGETVRTVEIARQLDQRDISLIVGISSPEVDKVLQKAEHASKYGINIGLLAPLSYVKPRQNGIINFYEEVASKLANECPEFKLIVYNVPSRVGVNIEPATLGRLADVKNIVAVKEASGNLIQMSDYVNVARTSSDRVGRPFTVLSGDDATTYHACHLGAHGVISVVSNIAPMRMKRLVECSRDGSFKKDQFMTYDLHKKLEPYFKASMVAGNPQSIILMMQLMGYPIGSSHPLLGFPTSDDAKSIHNLLTGTIIPKECYEK